MTTNQLTAAIRAALRARYYALALVLLALMLGACTPKPLIIRTPVEVCPEPTIVVSKVPAELTVREPIPTGGLAECPDIAKRRGELLDRIYYRLCLISKNYGGESDLECKP